MSDLTVQFIASVYKPLFVIVLLFIFLLLLFLNQNKLRKLKKDSKEQSENLKRRLYEIKVLDELYGKFGYSLNVERVLDTVAASLNVLFKYSVASFLLLEGNKLIFKARLLEDVPKSYIQKLKDKMFAAIKELAPEQNIDERYTKEEITGGLLDEEKKGVVASFFNVPLTVRDRVVGIFNISSTLPGVFKDPEVTLLYKVASRAMDAISSLYTIIEQEKGKLEAMVENMTDGVLMIDKDFSLLVINPACIFLLGLEDVSNLNIFKVSKVFEESFPFEETIAGVFRSGASKTVSEIRVREKYFLVTVVPVKIEGEILGAGILIHDQSKEHELMQLREDFTAMMIHELRSPLTVILGTADFISKELVNLDHDKETELLGAIKSSSSGLLSVVNDLLDASKVESGKFEVSKESNDINKLLSEEVYNYSNLAKSKGTLIKLDLDGSIGGTLFDYARITQVLNNLLSNAIKFTKNGEITVKSEKLSDSIKVTIYDTGVGIPDDMKPKLFKKFAQFRKAPSTSEFGTGLGLVIAKGIIEAHGGKIWIEDNYPKGSKFIFSLPLK